MLLGLVGYANDSYYARVNAEGCDRLSESTGEVNTACEELRDRATQFIVSAVSNKAIILLISQLYITGVVWRVHIHYWCSSDLGDHLYGSWLQQSFASTERGK